MSDVVVATVDGDAVAEIIAGRLQADGIAARVRYDSQAGVPRPIAPSGIGFGPGAFRVVVDAADADQARAILAEAGEPPARRNPILRVVALVVLIAFVLTWIPGVLELVRALF